MGKTFYFYDLETSGFNPREARIMQFAGQRTDMQLQPIGEPDNFLIRMSEDVVPDPDAILITGITPQKTIADGLREAEFLSIFHKQISIPDTIFVGYNSVRFDDEFMRYLNYRNYYDPYEWQWQSGRSRWDLLDVVRMTRALRPDGIVWPFDSDGKPANRLGMLTELNHIEHSDAHDALADVRATIALAQLIRAKQPKLFDFLLRMREKNQIRDLVQSSKPFVYTSGKYDSKWEKTTVVATVAEHPKRGVLVFDLRFDPGAYIKLSVAELAEAWVRRWDDPGLKLPVKTLQFNRCPAVAPLSVLDKESVKRLGLSLNEVDANFTKLNELDLSSKLLKALEILDEKRQAQFFADETDVDARLYDGFFDDQDRKIMQTFQTAKSEDLSAMAIKFKDDRLRALLPLYKARNFPNQLSGEERTVWDKFCQRKLLSGKNQSRLAKFFGRLEELASKTSLSGGDQYILEELRLYGESIMPEVE